MELSIEHRQKITEALKGNTNGRGCRGRRYSEETRRKMSGAKKGKYCGEKHPLWGKPCSEETKRRIGEAHKGKKLSVVHRKKISEALKGEKNHFYGKNHTKEARNKVSMARKGKYMGEKNPFWGKKHTTEVRRKISEAGRGRILSEETRRKMSEAHMGSKSYLWQGGKSFEPYTIEWTRLLRKNVRERDNYTCQLGGERQNNKLLAVHHIDYDKKNCNPENLITLCQKCHRKTNFKREYWMRYFTQRNGDK